MHAQMYQKDLFEKEIGILSHEQKRSNVEAFSHQSELYKSKLRYLQKLQDCTFEDCFESSLYQIVKAEISSSNVFGT